MQRAIRDLAAERRSSDDPAAEERPLTPAETLRQQRIRDLRTQMDDIDRQLAEKQEQDRCLRAVIGDFQAKLDAVPKRESDLVALARDYTTLQTSYQSLLAKREEAKLSANLERRNIGEQFKVLDPARIPERPFSPNRLQIELIGAGAGLALGLLLVGFLEYRDSSFKTEDEVIRVLSLPVLALVPLMTSTVERHSAAVMFWRLQS